MMGNQEMTGLLEKEGYLKTPGIIQAFRKVDRKLFVPDKRAAYQDLPQPIPRGQTISAPHMVAIMLELLELKKTDTVLEVGGGSGYAAALLGALAKEVTSLEVDEALVRLAQRNLEKAGITNATVLHQDGSKGLPGKKFDKILFSCAVREIPSPVLSQLKDPGILLAPVGGPFGQDLILLRKEKGKTLKENHGGCVFVPLRSER